MASLTIETSQEMIDAIDYIVKEAKGLGYESVDEFCREALRKSIFEISKNAVTQK